MNTGPDRTLLFIRPDNKTLPAGAMLHRSCKKLSGTKIRLIPRKQECVSSFYYIFLPETISFRLSLHIYFRASSRISSEVMSFTAFKASVK